QQPGRVPRGLGPLGGAPRLLVLRRGVGVLHASSLSLGAPGAARLVDPRAPRPAPRAPPAIAWGAPPRRVRRDGARRVGNAHTSAMLPPSGAPAPTPGPPRRGLQTRERGREAGVVSAARQRPPPTGRVPVERAAVAKLLRGGLPG